VKSMKSLINHRQPACSLRATVKNEQSLILNANINISTTNFCSW